MVLPLLLLILQSNAAVLTLSIARTHIAATSVGSKAIFAGGLLDGGSSTNRVDIFDLSTKQWTIANLSIPRNQLIALTVGTKSLFTGGLGGPGFLLFRF